MSDLKEALEESNLPIRVDVFIWDEIPESLKTHTLQAYVVLIHAQEQGKGGGAAC